MSAIEKESALQKALYGSVRCTSNNTRDLRAKALRVTGGSPEVMVKITSFGKGRVSIGNQLQYIARNGDIELETDRGDLLRGKEAVTAYFDAWATDCETMNTRKDQRDTVHIVLSMPPGTSEVAVLSAARSFAGAKFSANHEYVFGLHTDEDHPHVHLVVKTRGFDGKWLNPRKADLQDWREGFALALRDQGVDAEATSRTARGVLQKPQRAVIRHIEQGDEAQPGRTPRIYRDLVNEAAAELMAAGRGGAVEPTPSSQLRGKALAAHRAKREAWLEAAAALEQEPSARWIQTAPPPDYANVDPVKQRAIRAAVVRYQAAQYNGLPPAVLARRQHLNRPGTIADLAREAPRLQDLRPPAPAVSDKELAGRIRSFVDRMDAVRPEALRYEQVKAGLQAHLAASRGALAPSVAPTVMPTAVPIRTTAPDPAPKPRPRDLER